MEKQTKIGTVPEGWKVKKLKEVFHINELSLPSNTDANYKFKYIPIEFVSTNHIDYGNCESFRFVDAPGRARRIVRENDILISSVRPNLKSFAVFKKPDDSNWICSTGFYVLTAKEESDNLFSYYELLSEIGESQFYSYVAGSNYPAIGDGDIRNMKLMFPKDKSEQSAIAAILSKVDEAIASVQASIAAAERLKKSLMQNLLSGRMKPDGTLRKEDEFYVDEKFGRVPKGWEVKKLKDIADIQRGKFGHRPRNDERFYNGEYPFVQTNDVVESVFYLKKASQTLNELGIYVSKCFPSGTIIMTIAANIGFVAITNYKVYFPDSLIGINANEQIILSTYMLLQLMGYKNILDAQATESAQKNINYSNLFPLLIPYPTDKQEQKQIVERIKKVFDTIENKQKKIAVLERLKKSLMQNLLTGRVRVNKE